MKQDTKTRGKKIMSTLFWIAVWIGVLHTAYACMQTAQDPYTSFPWWTNLVVIGVPYLVGAAVTGFGWLFFARSKSEDEGENESAQDTQNDAPQEDSQRQ